MSHERDELEIIIHPPSPGLTSDSGESDPDISPSSPQNEDSFSQDQRGIVDERSVEMTSPETSTGLLTVNMSTQTVHNEKNKVCCSVTCHRIKRINEILAWVRLAFAFSLYLLIVVDVIHIRKNQDKKFWIEILTQLTNAEFTLLTIIMQPKRIMNLPRAAQIWWWSITHNTSSNKSKLRKSAISQETKVDLKVNNSAYHLQDTNSYKPPDHIRELQRKVHKSYNWYNYEEYLSEESEKKKQREIICSPSKLLFILILWNIACLSQYGICVILWFIPPKQRPELPYIILSAIMAFFEVVAFILIFYLRKWNKMLNHKDKLSKRFHTEPK